MKEEKIENNFLGRRGRELVETIPVGGRIPRKMYHLWEEFKNFCYMVGLRLSPDGLQDMLMTYTEINRVLYPMARDYGFEPVEFKTWALKTFLSEMRKIHDQEWKDDSTKTKEYINDKIQTAVHVGIH